MTEFKNLLLGLLPREAAEEFLSAAELIFYDLRESVSEPNKSVEFVDFVESGVISMVLSLEDGPPIEIANIGYEGMTSVHVLQGIDSIPQKCFCQVEGSGLRITLPTFRRLLNRHPEMQDICRRYAVTQYDQTARNLACYRAHSIEERCARWILMTGDRCHDKDFLLTQEFLAMMLGVSRTGVNLAAGILSKAKLITYVRGRISILDREGLESVCCECYEEAKHYYDFVMNHSGSL